MLFLIANVHRAPAVPLVLDSALYTHCHVQCQFIFYDHFTGEEMKHQFASGNCPRSQTSQNWFWNIDLILEPKFLKPWGYATQISSKADIVSFFHQFPAWHLPASSQSIWFTPPSSSHASGTKHSSNSALIQLQILGVFCSALPVLPAVSAAGSVLKPCPSLDLDNFSWVALLLTSTSLHTAVPCFLPPALLPLASPKCERFPCSVLC